MKIFDTHTHIFPDCIARIAISHLRAQSGNLPAFTDGTAADQKQKAEAAGYTAWMNCPVCTKPGQALRINAKNAVNNSGPCYSLGGMHPQDDDLTGIVHQIQDLGLHGIKFHPEYQNFAPLDPSLESLWSLLEREKLPLIFHAGKDAGFPPPYHSTFADFIQLAGRHPELPIIAGHLGGWKEWDLVEAQCREKQPLPPNLYLDTAFTLEEMADPLQMKRIVQLIGTDHVLYGTDSPWADMKTALQKFLSLHFSAEEQEKILWSNAIRFWNIQA